MLLHYLGKLKNQNFALFVQVKHATNVTLLFIIYIQQISVKCHKNTCKD